MVQFFESIPDYCMDWIPHQELFWVATAPLSGDGHVNVSPKGLRGTFHLVGPNKVWYEDMSGSGSETIAHLRENGRITIMFSAFQGPPRILRLWGTGIAHEFGTPEYDAFIPHAQRRPGMRAAIVIDVHKVATSCGYGVPFYAFEGHRPLLYDFFGGKERTDLAHEASLPSLSSSLSSTSSSSDTSSSSHPEPAPPFSEKGIRAYWRAHAHSIDGLPSMTTGFDAPRALDHLWPVPAQAERPREAKKLTGTDSVANTPAGQDGAKVERAWALDLTPRDARMLAAGGAAGLVLALISARVVAVLAAVVRRP